MVRKKSRKKVVQKKTTEEIRESGGSAKKKLRKIHIAKPLKKTRRIGNIRTLRDSNTPRRNGKGLRSI